MIDRRVVLVSALGALVAPALTGSFWFSKALAIDPEPIPPMPAVPDEFRERAAQLGYNLDGLWITFHQLQSSYESRNISTLWAVSSAPLLLIGENRRIEINSLKELEKFKQLVFSDSVRSAVMKCQFPSLFLNSEGAMIGDGEVWLKDICLDQACTLSKFAIVTIDRIKE